MAMARYAGIGAGFGGVPAARRSLVRMGAAGLLLGTALSPALAAPIDLNGATLNVGALTGGGSTVYVNNAAGAARITVQGTGSGTYFGSIGGGTGGPISLRKEGAGAQILASASTYAGGTELVAGTLRVNNSLSLGTGTLSVLGAATLGFNTGNLTLGNAIVLNDALTVTAAGIGTLSGVISGNGSLVRNSNGIVVLTRANTFAGGVQLNAGQITIAHNGALGTGTLTAGSTQQVTLGFANTLTTANNISVGQILNFEVASGVATLSGTISGPGQLYLKDGPGTLVLTGNNTVGAGRTLLLGSGVLGIGSAGALGGHTSIDFDNVSGNPVGIAAYTSGINVNRNMTGGIELQADTRGLDMTFSGSIANKNAKTASLTKLGEGTLTLSATSSYTGPTQVELGTLNLTGTLISTVTVNGGTLAGTGRSLGDNIVNFGTLAAGNNGSGIGTLTLGNLTLGTGALSSFNLGTAGVVGGADNDLIIVNGNLNLGGSLNILGSGPFGIGTYRLFTYDGVLGGTLALGSTPTGFSYLVDTATAGQVNLIVGSLALSAYYWDGNGTAGDGFVSGGPGTWNAANSNWTDASGVPTGVWGNALTTQGFFTNMGGAVTVAGTQQFGTLTFSVGGYTLSGGELAQAGGTIQTDAGTTVIDSVISGGALTKTGTGTLQLGGANTYTGGTILSAGTLAIGNDAALGTGTLSMADGTTVRLAAPFAFLANDIVIAGTGIFSSSSNGLFLDGVVSGGAIRKIGTERLGLYGANTFAGGVDLEEGSIDLGNDLGLGTGSLRMSGNTILASFRPAITAENEIVLAAGDQTVQVSGNLLALNGMISGDGRLTKVGGGTLALNGANSFAGGLTIQGGPVALGSNTGAGTGAITMFDGTTLTAASSGLVVTNAVTILGNGLINTNGNTFTLSGVVSGDALRKVNTGTLSLTGANTFAGGVQLQTGTIVIGNDQALGTGTLTMANGTGLVTTAPSITATNAVVINGFSNVIVLGSDLTLSGPISGAGRLAKGGGGTLILGETNTHSGGTQIIGGTVGVTGNGSAGTGQLVLGAGTRLLRSANAPVLANAVLVGGAATIDTNGGDLTLAGAITGAGGIAKAGTGTLTLTGAVNYSGATGVNAGTLMVNGSLGNTAVTVASGATLAGTGAIAGNVSVLDGGIVSPGASPGTLTVGGMTLSNLSLLNFELGAANTVGGALNDRIVVTGALTLDGILNISQSAGGSFGLGYYNLFSYGTLVDNGLTVNTLPGGFTGTVQVNSAAQQVNLIVANPGTLVQYWDGTDFTGAVAGGQGGAGVWNAANTNWAGDAPGLINAAWQPLSTGIFAGTAGTVQVASNNSFTGMIFQTDGYVLANGGGSLSLNPTGSFIAVDPGLTTRINAIVTGAADLAKQAGGTLILGAANTYSGNTLLQAGTLGVGDNAALGTGSMVMSGGTTLLAATGNLTIANAISTLGSGRVDTAGNRLTLAGNISGLGSISNVGGGVLVLNGNNSFTNLGINTGTVTLGTNTAAGVGGIALNNNATLAAGAAGLVIGNAIETTGNGLVNTNGNTFTLAGSIGGAGSISNVGGGNLVLNGNNSFVNLGINTGTVTLGTSTAAGVGGIALNNNATLAAGAAGLIVGNGITTTANGLVNTNGATFTLAGSIGGAGSISNMGGGNLVLNGANTFRNLGINSGTVTLGTSTAAGSGGIALSSNATLAAGAAGLVIGNAIETTGNGLINSNGNTFTLAGSIGGAGSISNVGGGNLVLNGNNAFRNLGINSGTVTLGTSTAAGTGGIALNSNATLAAGVGGLVIANAIETTGNGRVNTSGSTFTLAGPIGGAGSISNVGGGNLVLNGNNSFRNLGINTGTVTLGTNTAAGTGGIALNDNATLAAGAPGLVIGNAIETTGNGLVNANGFTFTLNGPIGGAGSISNVNGGNLVLNGNNAFRNLGINNGTVTLGSNTAAGVGGIALNSNAVLGAGVTGLVIANAIETTGNGLVNTNNLTMTLAGPIGGAGSISTIGGGNLILNGANSFVNLGINWGTVTLGTNTAAGVGGIALNTNSTLAAGAAGLVIGNAIETTGNGLVSTNGNTFTLAGPIGGAGSISNVGGGNLVLNGNNAFRNLGINTGTVTLGTNTAAGIGGIALNNNATLAAGAAGLVIGNRIETTGNGLVNTNGNTFTLGGSVGGPGSISNVGGGNLVLNGANSFVNLGINTGTVTLGTSTAAGSGGIALNSNATLAAGANNLVVTNGVTTTANGLINTNGNSFTLAGSIGGAGSLSNVGGGNLVLNGANTFAGGLGINTGTVTLGTTTAAGSGGIALNNNATLAAGVPGLVIANGITTTGNGLIDTNGFTFTLAGVIDGPGSISNVDGGNLVLNGANAFRNLGINSGTVTLGTNTAAGIGAIALNSNATLAAGVAGLVIANGITTTGNGLVNTNGSMLTLAGVIDGAGSISNVGGGNLVLNGANRFTNLGINTGTVTLGSNTAAGAGAIALSGDTTLAAGAANLAVANRITTTGNGLIDTNGFTFTLAGVIDGPGSISNVDGGNLVLNGANAFRNLGINTGTVTLGNNTAAGIGGVALNNNATLAAGTTGLVVANRITTTGNGLVNTNGNTLTLSGVIDGAGSISNVGGGNLVLNGANAFRNLGINSGTVTLGTNTAAGVGAIALNNATLAAGATGLVVANRITTTGTGQVNTNGNALTLSGVIDGAGGLTKAGAGTLNLSAANVYTGATSVAAGTLNLTGSLASATTVQAGAILTGTGTTAGLTVNGTVSPGVAGAADVGTLRVNGPLTMAAGSTYAVTVTATSSDLIVVSGAASLNGQLSLTTTGAFTQFNQSYTVLTAGSRAGTFTGAANSTFGSAFTPVVDYVGNTVVLRLAPASLVNQQTTLVGPLQANALEVASAFDRAVSAGYNPQPFFALWNQGSNLPAALNQLSGELHAAERRVLLEDTRVVRETAFDRLNAGLSTVSGQAVTTEQGDAAITFWLRGAGSWGTASAGDGYSRFTTEQRGVLTGLDYAKDGFKAGAMFTYTNTDVEFTSLGRSTVKSTGGAVYGGYRAPDAGIVIGLGASAAGTSAKGSRAVTVPGLAQTLTSNYDGKVWQAFGEIAYDLASSADTRIEPFARLGYAKLTTDAFGEGGGIAAVNGAEQSSDLTLIQAGLRGGINLGGNTWLSGSAGWQRATGDRSAATQLAISGLGQTGNIQAVALDENALALQADAQFRVSGQITLGIGYSGIIGSRNTDHAGRATLTVGF